MRHATNPVSLAPFCCTQYAPFLLDSVLYFFIFHTIDPNYNVDIYVLKKLHENKEMLPGDSLLRKAV